MGTDIHDEITVVTRVGFPATPHEMKDTYFEQIVSQMAVFVEEVRGYRSDLARKAENDDTNWIAVKNEISGVRRDFDSLRTELRQFQSNIRSEVEEAKRQSDSKIRALEERVLKLEQALERGHEARERVTLVPPPDGPTSKTAVG